MSEGIPDWTFRKPYPGIYKPPAEPKHFNNLQWSRHDLYYKFGLQEEYRLNQTLDYRYFDHNYPLAVWTGDGIVAKVEKPEEFADLVRFTWNNQAVLPGWYNVPPFPFQKIMTFADFKVYVAELEKNINKDLLLWKARQAELINYMGDVQGYRREMGQQIPQIPWDLKPLKTLPKEFVLSDDELKSDPKNKKAIVYLERIRKHYGKITRYSPKEIIENIEKLEKTQG